MQDEYSHCPECDGQRVDAKVSTWVTSVGPNGPIGGSGKLGVIRNISFTSMFLGRFPFQGQKRLVSTISSASVCIECGHITLYADSPGSLIEEETLEEEISREEEPLSTTSAAARLGRFFGNIFRKR